MLIAYVAFFYFGKKPEVHMCMVNFPVDGRVSIFEQIGIGRHMHTFVFRTGQVAPRTGSVLVVEDLVGC